MTTTPGYEWPQNDPLFDLSLDMVAEGVGGNGVLADGDLNVTATANANEIQVAAGEVFYDGTVYSEGAASTFTLSDNTSGDDRWDLVYYDTGVPGPAVREGTPSTTPEPPLLQAGEFGIAYVYVADGQTDVTDSEVKNWQSLGDRADATYLADAAGDYNSDTVEGALGEISDDYVDESGDTMTGQLDISSGGLLVSGGGATVSAGDFTASGGDITDGTNVVYDLSATEVPQARLGGPAAALSSYPLPIGDLDSPYALPSITDMDVAGSDLVDGATTLYDATAGEFVQSELGGPASSLSTYPLSLPTDTEASAYPLAAADIGTDSVTDTEIDLSITPTWTGTHQFNSTVQLNDGTAAAPSFTFSSATGTGMHLAGGTVSITQGGTQAAAFNSSKATIVSGTIDGLGTGVSAGSGAIRLANESRIRARNSGDTGDFGIKFLSSDDIALDTGLYVDDDITFSSEADLVFNAGYFISDTSNKLSIATTGSGTDTVRIFDASNDESLFAFNEGGPISVQGNSLTNIGGINDAQSGAIRLSNTSAIFSRDSSDSADGLIAKLNSADNMVMGNAAVSDIYLGMADNLRVAGSGVHEIGGTADANNGAIRLANGSRIAWRNNGDTTDHTLAVKGGDGLVYKIGTTRAFTIDGSGRTRLEGNILSQVGDTPSATSGSIRMGNDTFINARNAADDADIRAIGTNSNDVVVVGGNNAARIVFNPGNGAVKLRQGNLDIFDHNITIKSDTGNKRIGFNATGVGDVLAVGCTDTGERGFIYNPIDGTTALNFFNSNAAGGERIRVGNVPFLADRAVRFAVPTKGADPTNATDGDIWYRSDLDEYRGVEGGTTVSFNTTAA